MGLTEAENFVFSLRSNCVFGSGLVASLLLPNSMGLVLWKWRHTVFLRACLRLWLQVKIQNVSGVVEGEELWNFVHRKVDVEAEDGGSCRQERMEVHGLEVEEDLS